MDEQPSHDPAERFIAQFAWDGAQPIYRRDRTGPAYLISVDEYQSFIETHHRHGRWSTWLYVVALLAMFAVIFLTPLLDGLGTPFQYFLACFSLVILSGSLDRWRFLAPTRALRARTPISPPLSKDERLSLAASERSWMSLFLAVVYNCLLIALAMEHLFDGSPPWTRWFFIFVIMGLLGHILFQMVRKWRVESRLRAPTAGLPA